MYNNKISPHPPTKKTAQDFILEAEKKVKKTPSPQLPWQDGKIRDDVQKVFSVKLPEEYLLKIKYVSEITNKSQQKIIRDIIKSSIDEILSSLDIS